MSELPQGPRTSLVGREKYEPNLDEEQIVEQHPEGLAIPGPCLWRLQTLDHRPVPPICPSDCPGRQRDGGCAADLVRGRPSWQFTIDLDGYWILTDA